MVTNPQRVLTPRSILFLAIGVYTVDRCCFRNPPNYPTTTLQPFRIGSPESTVEESEL